jgi:hypothetical protein
MFNQNTEHKTLSSAMLEDSQIENVKAAIKKVLKVDAKTGSVLEIQAACHGYKDFNTVKGLAKKDFYFAKANMGTRTKPFWIEKTLGQFEHYHEAMSKAEEVLVNCQDFIKWFIFKNDENTNSTIQSMPNPEKGFEYKITISGETISDIKSSLDEVKERIDNREVFDSNETSEFNFVRAGSEYDPMENVEISFNENYVIFDSKGVIESERDEDDIEAKWSSRDDKIKEWDDYLIYGESVDLDEAWEHSCSEPNSIFYVVKFNGGAFSHGDYDDIIESLENESGEFNIFRVVKTN